MDIDEEKEKGEISEHGVVQATEGKEVDLSEEVEENANEKSEVPLCPEQRSLEVEVIDISGEKEEGPPNDASDRESHGKMN